MQKKPSGQHWSASRFMLYEQCPRLYKARYIDGVASIPSLPMLFGSAVHQALETLHRGQGGGCPPRAAREDGPLKARAVYSMRFDEMSDRLGEMEPPVVATMSLYTSGLRMLELVADMKLNSDARSEPEYWFRLPTAGGRIASWIGGAAAELYWRYDTIGAVDLWSPPWSKHGAVVWDFKTTAGKWSQARAESERWQPLLYTWAYVRAFGIVPTFRYLVLNRIDSSAVEFDRTWPRIRDWQADMNDLFFHAEEIAEAVAEGNFTCTRGHGTCLECGEAYGHDHVCADAHRSNKIHLSRHGLDPSPA